MNDVAGTLTFSAALLAGIAGSAHCLVMCGGLSGALSMRGARADAWVYHAGRLGGYTTAGAVFGLFGASLSSAVNLPMLSTIARVAAGLLVILVAVRVLFGLNALTWVERLGAWFWKLLRPLATHAVGNRSPARSLLLGLLWGWLPCGLVYSILLLAALSGEALRGAGIMIAFGIGTLPAMLTGSMLGAQMNRWLGVRQGRRLSGAVLLLFGLWLAWAALPLQSQHAGHHDDGPKGLHGTIEAGSLSEAVSNRPR